MDLDFNQSRRLALAGTVAFPQPLTTVGVVRVTPGKLTYDRDGKTDDAPLVIVDEPAKQPNESTTRVIQAVDVAAIFLPAKDVRRVDNFDDGTWYLRPIMPAKDPGSFFDRLLGLLGVDKPTPGIVFVNEDRPVLTIRESTQTAGVACELHRGFFCEPDPC